MKDLRTRTTALLLAGSALAMGGVAMVWYWAGAWYAVVGAVLLVAGLGDLALALWLNARVPAQSGPEGLVGKRGIVTEGFAVEHGRCLGRVRIGGEDWRAQGNPGQCTALAAGQGVTVTGSSGLLLHVQADGKQSQEVPPWV
ncbi:MAG TPA: NfeD family protein [Gammaproteobacteria bacterium]|nr:NfeD family protein [Gammaproteobacteria bacterium]